MKSINILGVKVNNITMDEAVETAFMLVRIQHIYW